MKLNAIASKDLAVGSDWIQLPGKRLYSWE